MVRLSLEPARIPSHLRTRGGELSLEQFFKAWSSVRGEKKVMMFEMATVASAAGPPR